MWDGSIPTDVWQLAARGLLLFSTCSVKQILLVVSPGTCTWHLRMKACPACTSKLIWMLLCVLVWLRRFSENFFVVNESFRLVFYVMAPLISSNGHRIGTL
jgi:hypothetical protein